MAMCFIVYSVDRHSQERIFGVFSSREKATEAANKVKARYKEKNYGGFRIAVKSYPFNPDPEHV